MEVKCINCQKQFSAKTAEIKRGGGKYCSRECYRLHIKSQVNLCKNCQKETTNPNFCCRSCSVTFNNILNPKRTKHSKINGNLNLELKINTCVCGQLKKYNRQYCSRKCFYKHKWQARVIELEQKGFFHNETCFTRSHTARRYLEYKFGKKCSICQIDTWENKPLVLIVDHINGKPNDWTISNTRLVCPNCDSQLPTFKGRNTGNGGRPSRRISSA